MVERPVESEPVTVESDETLLLVVLRPDDSDDTLLFVEDRPVDSEPTPVSYTHLDVYKRQAVGGREASGERTGYGGE